jgi:Oxidoreductase family, NAD-binding Rossmann fold
MNSKQKIYTAAIIGAGRIGTGFDGPHSKVILTHAHALKKNQRTKLAAIVDTDPARGERESKRWGAPFFTDVEKMFEAVQPDIIVIATPDTTHVALLKKIAALKPKLIICEKPVVQNARQVNYTRRFDPVMREVREHIKKGKYGMIISVSATYSGDLLHRGSHTIDTVRFLFGEIETLPQFHLIKGDQSCYSIFELDILASKMRIRVSDAGLKIMTQPVIKDPLFKGFRTLGKETVRKTGYLQALPELVRNAVSVLDRKAQPIASLQEAIKTERAVFSIEKRFRKGTIL